MRRDRWYWFTALLPLAVAGLPAALAAAEITFEQQIAPILTARCVKCHGGETLDAGLDLRRRATMLKGGDSGPAIVAGEVAKSLLIERVDSGEMPPKDEPPLEARERELIRQWVATGAPLAGESEPPLDTADTPSRLTREDRDFWAFKPPVRPAVPAVKNSQRVRTAHRCLFAGTFGSKGTDTQRRRTAPGAVAAALFRSARPGADARTDRRLSDRHACRCLRAARRSAARRTAIWRTVGPALAGRGRLCRFRWLPGGRSPSPGSLAVSRLRHPLA